MALRGWVLPAQLPECWDTFGGTALIWPAESGGDADLYFDDTLRPAEELAPFDWRCSWCGNVHSGGTYKCPDCGANKGRGRY